MHSKVTQRELDMLRVTQMRAPPSVPYPAPGPHQQSLRTFSSISTAPPASPAHPSLPPTRAQQPMQAAAAARSVQPWRTAAAAPAGSRRAFAAAATPAARRQAAVCHAKVELQDLDVSSGGTAAFSADGTHVWSTCCQANP